MSDYRIQGMMKTKESERNIWRGKVLAGIYPSRDDMFRLLDDADAAEEMANEFTCEQCLGKLDAIHPCNSCLERD